MKRIVVKILILSLFIISCFLLFIKLFSLPKIECILEEKEDLYQKKQSIILKYKKDTVIEIIKKEKITSPIQNILDIKQNEYEKKEYSIIRRGNTISTSKREKIQEEYNEALKNLTKEGYKCTGD